MTSFLVFQFPFWSRIFFNIRIHSQSQPLSRLFTVQPSSFNFSKTFVTKADGVR